MMRAVVLWVAAVVSPATAQDIKPLWQTRPSEPAGVQRLALAGDVLLAVSGKGHFLALDTVTGKTLWRDSSAGDFVVEGPWLVASGAFVGGARYESNTLTARGLRSGETRWTRTLGGQITGLVACKHVPVWVVTRRLVPSNDKSDRRLAAEGIDPKTGRTLWLREVNGWAVAGGESDVFLMLRQDLGRHGEGFERLACADGALAELEMMDRPIATPAAVSGDTFVAKHYRGAFGSQRVCLHRPGKSARCVEDAQLTSQRVIDLGLADGRLYVATLRSEAKGVDGELVAFDVKTDQVVARSAAKIGGRIPVPTGPLVLSGYASNGDENFVSVLDAKTLRSRGRIHLAKAPTEIVTDGERAYIVSLDGAVTAIKLPVTAPAPLKLQPETTPAK